MTAIKKVHSIKHLLLTTIIGLISVLFIAAFSLITYILIQQANEHIEDDNLSWVKLISETSIPSLKNNEFRPLNKSLQILKTISPINYVHIYRINDSNKVEFFTSYNKNEDFPPIADKINDIERLSQLSYTSEYIELITEIKDENKVYGYIYVQTSLEHRQNFIQKMSLMAVCIILLSIIITFFVIIKLRNKITKPITRLIEQIQHISQRKDYSVRLEAMPYKELDILARNMDILLTRTEKHITKQNEAKQLVAQQNKDLESKVTKRTDALKESNQELLSTLEKLHQFQGQLVENEKMASLGDMVAGVAHEVNTPIGLGVTASTLLSDRLDEIKQHFEEKTLKSSQLKKFLDEGQENVGIIYRNLNRAAELISSFKKVAVDQSNEDTRQFNMKELLDEVLLSLAPQLKTEPIDFELTCPGDLNIYSKPGPINQILINLILNSVIHGFEGLNHGTISISIIILSDQLHINYCDDGNGIDDNIKTRIFEPFTTTKRGSGGSGLGLHLVYNLVTQALDGQINFTSEKNQGVSFEITFPVNSQKQQYLNS